jgi:hypothetical protein
MESREWRPVVEVNSDGLVLAIGAEGRWMVGRDEASARPADEVHCPTFDNIGGLLVGGIYMRRRWRSGT